MRLGAMALALWAVGALACGGESSPDAGGGGPDAAQAGAPEGSTAFRRDAGPDECNPPCQAGQRCDTLSTPPVCVELCNQGNGCVAGWEVCDEATGLCNPISCGAQQCELGQGCFDPATGAPGGECTCLPERADGSSDSCARYGKICDVELGRCRFPGAKEECTAKIGCDPASPKLECVKLGLRSLCLARCGSSAECEEPTDFCVVPQPGTQNTSFDYHCWYNVCADPGDPLTPGNTPSQERAYYFKPCPTGEDDPGTCIPSYLDGPEGEDLGLCLAGGSAPSRGECVPGASRFSPADSCAAGELCVPLASDPASGTCAPACNAAPGPDVEPAASCPGMAAFTCRDISGLGEEPAVATIARVGLCSETCDSASCTPGAPCLGCPLAFCCARTCVPGRCGDDGCGGTCGCAAGQVCASGSCEPCVPHCTELVCGNDDGCGGVCGCGAGETCSDGVCVGCVPACDGKACGPDGCGASCGPCGGGQVCNAGACVPCTPDCAAKPCGDDGCGGSCGECGAGERCAPVHPASCVSELEAGIGWCEPL